jgi:hypothetical protein
MRMRVWDFIVYKAHCPGGEVYIGRTKLSIEERAKCHARTSTSPLYNILKLYPHAVTWSVLWTGDSFNESMEVEIAEIEKAKRRGERVLNRTRGGWYDRTDSPEARKKIAKWRRNKRRKDLLEGGGVKWVTPPSTKGRGGRGRKGRTNR